jgi:chromosome partitioning protein
MHVLSVSSLKGGVGKTTVTLGLASAAFSKGLRTLVVDLDPQSDVSTGMDINVAGHLNVADVLTSPKEKIVRAAIAPSGWTKERQGVVDVMIGSPSAINFDGPHPSIRDIWKLEEALATVEADYDLVLIDCAPSLNALTRTAWAASDRGAVVTEPGRGEARARLAGRERPGDGAQLRPAARPGHPHGPHRRGRRAHLEVDLGQDPSSFRHEGLSSL